MQQNAVCSRCGILLVNGRCPSCGEKAPPKAVTPASSARPRLRRSGVLARVVATLGAGWVVFGMVAVHIVQDVVRARHARAAAKVVPMRNWPRHLGPVAPVSALQGHGRIYLVQMGQHKDPYDIAEFARSVGSQYGLDIRVLPPSGLDGAAWDPVRHQYIAEALCAQLEREHAALAADADAYLIGFTDADMYTVTQNWGGTFTERDGQRTAVISSDEMRDTDRWRVRNADGHTGTEHLQARMRRILLKDIALLYWHLPFNNDPTSLLDATLNPDKPTDDIYQSDLDPAESPWGEYVWRPCLFLGYSAETGLRPLPGRPIRGCDEAGDLPVSERTELFEVELEFGFIVVRHRDFDEPGEMPIRFERALRPGWPGPDSFGASGTDNYNSYLSSSDNIQINVNQDDGSVYRLIRSPRWLPLLGLAKYVDQEMSGRYYEMRWHGGAGAHYELRRYDGTLATYLPCGNSVVLKCYLDGVRDADGRKLVFVRDGQRRLEQLSSGENHWLHLTYGPSGPITAITGDDGRTVRYGYNNRDQLVSVSYPSGEQLHYTWDDEQNLLTFSAAPDAHTEPRVLLRNEYDHGILVKMTIADGGAYTFTYDPVDSVPARGLMLATPDGNAFRMWLSGENARLWEQRAATSAASTKR